MKKIVFLFQLLSLFSTLASAHVVVISDLDDTNKVANVRDHVQIALNAPRTANVFRGMPYLFRQIQLRHPGSVFYYISQAPKFLMQGRHQKFLSDNRFPEGHLVLRDNLSEKQHKIKAMREILKDPSIDLVILVGDNGEKDPKIYAQLVSEYPHVKFVTFIRHVYALQGPKAGQPLEPNQIAFVTPVEIAVVLKNMGLMDELQVMNLETEFVPPTLARAKYEDEHGTKGTLSFPRWMDTRDHEISKEVLGRDSKYCKMLVKRIQDRSNQDN